MREILLSPTFYEVLFFFYIYAFIGWISEVTVMSVLRRRFVNRGLLDLPILPEYGIEMIFILFALSVNQQTFFGFHIILCMIVVSIVTSISDFLFHRISGKELYWQDKRSIFSTRKEGIIFTVIVTAWLYILANVLHPLLYLFYGSFLQNTLTRVIMLIILVITSLDLVVIFYTIYRRKINHRGNLEQNLYNQKVSFGHRILNFINRRIAKNYPELILDSQDNTTIQDAKAPTFAKGLSLDKIIWIFLITGILGDIIETFYVFGTAHIWMRRSSIIFIPISIVWGLGGAILTVVLSRFAKKDDRYVFVAGFFFGGAYEYMCSVFTEVVYHVKYWDYSNMPFNIGGRTNLLFMFFWGILALVWIKLCYPYLSNLIEKIPYVAGKILTWICMVLFALDLTLSMMVMFRFNQRKIDPVSHNFVETYLDTNYPDQKIMELWPNISELSE